MNEQQIGYLIAASAMAYQAQMCMRALMATLTPEEQKIAEKQMKDFLEGAEPKKKRTKSAKN